MIPLLQTLLVISGAISTPGDSIISCCGTPWTAQGLSVGNSPHGHLIAIRDSAGLLKTIEWDSAQRSWTAWETLPAQSGSYSDPWVQAAVAWSPYGFVNNLFAISRTESNAARTSQWIRTPVGTQTTIGIGEADSIWFRPASARLGLAGTQALFAVFRDSSLKMRLWDSVAREWSAWQGMGIKTGYPPATTQVDSQNVNLFVTLPDGSIRQNWWEVSRWNGWVVPAYGGAASEPSSVNINWFEHLLFSMSTRGLPQVRYWDGDSWTGWFDLKFPAKRALSPVVAGSDSVLLYGLDSADQIVRAVWKKGRGWSSAETLGLCPGPLVFQDSAPTPLIPTFTVRSELLKPSGSLAAFEGAVVLVHPDGSRLRMHKSAGSESFRVPLHGVGFLRYGTETARLIGIR